MPRVEAEVKAAFPTADIVLIKGGGGVFDVHMDGRLVYSNSISNGQFPPAGLIARILSESVHRVVQL